MHLRNVKVSFAEKLKIRKKKKNYAFFIGFWNKSQKQKQYRYQWAKWAFIWKQRNNKHKEMGCMIVLKKVLCK